MESDLNLPEKMQNFVKLFITGFLLIFLFIKSPLNPLYDGYNRGEMFFVYYSFIYWISVSVFILWIIYYVTKLNYEHLLPRIFVIAVFLWYLFFIPYGFDTTDTGYQLSKQWSMYHGKWSENFDAIAGTNLLGGLWLFVLGKPFLLWARFGFVILHTIICFTTYKMIVLYAKPVKAFMFTLLISIFTSYLHYYHTINYDNLPYLFMLVSMYCILKSSKEEKHSNILLLYSGIAAFLSFFCKITYIPALFLPVIILSADGLLCKKKYRIAVYKYISGIGIGVLLIVILASTAGGLNEYVLYFFNILRDFIEDKSSAEKVYALRDHSFQTLSAQYLKNIVFILKNSLFSLPFILIASVFIKKTKLYIVLHAMILLVFSWLFYFRIFLLDGNKANLTNGILSFYISLVIVWLLFFRPFDKNKTLFLFSAFAMFFISFAGSDLGIVTAFRSGSGILFISYISILLTDLKNNKYFKFENVVYVSLVLFTVFYMLKDYKPYRDSNFSEVQTSFQSPQVLGIKSSLLRVDSADSLLFYLNSSTNISHKKIFFMKSGALYYYLTGTNYPLNSPWDTVNDLEDISTDFNKKLPEIIVSSFSSHRDSKWPLTDFEWIKHSEYEFRAKRYYDFYEQFIKENNYIEVYKNSFYTVYSLSDEDLIDEQSSE